MTDSSPPDGVATPGRLANRVFAFKADPGSLEALRAARRIYWEMGRLGTIDKLVTLEMQITSDVKRQAELYRELVDAMLLLGQNDRAELRTADCLRASRLALEAESAAAAR